MRRIVIVVAMFLTVLGFVAFELQATIGIGGKIWNAGGFVVLNHISGSLGTELGVGLSYVVGTNLPFEKWVPTGFLDVKLYYPLKPLRSGFLINPYIGAGVIGVHYDRSFPGIGSATITAVAAEVVAGVDVCLSQLQVPITFVFALYAHVVNGAIVSYAGETHPYIFGTKVPKGFQLGIRVDF